MKTLTKLMITAALTASFTAAPAMAGPLDLIKNKAKSEAKKEAKKEMKKKAVEQAVSMTGTSESTATTAVDGAEKVMEMTGVIEAEPKADKSMMSKAMDMAKDGMKMKETSSEMPEEHHDATKMKHVDGEVDKVIQKAMPAPTAAAPMIKAPAAPMLPPVSCPEGTTAQDDGTCMITGDFDLN